ncbi:sensor histidine kinase [Plantactinospora siamensis]|uniref:histidine kinase n=1 Tax=Plantactinospora siamensis TaxID=555372 RepID=A0ABV6P4Y8_9ACTN
MTVLLRVLTEPFRARTWRETAHLLLGALVSVVCLAFVALLGYALIASVTVAGLALLAAVVASARAVSVVERARARLLAGTGPPRPAPLAHTRSGPVGWTRDALGDRTGWRCLLYALLAAPLGVAQAYLVALCWVESVAALSYPLWRGWLPSPGQQPAGRIAVVDWRWHPGDWPPHPVLVSAAGLVGLLATPWLVHGLTAADRLRWRLLPGQPADDRLRVMTRRRDQAVEQSRAHLRRLERDLHDGAQVRIVALAMELGRAREELEAGPPHPAAARVAAAHAEAKQALVELRDLARGIYPAVLTDLGLDGAVPMVAARCPVPVSTELELAARPTPVVEGTAYFCVGELLANLAKHSRARDGWVRIRRRGDHLVVQVGDDGAGGAVVRPGGGLAGLVERVDSVGGTLTVTSPAGGPTVVTVELPCVS